MRINPIYLDGMVKMYRNGKLDCSDAPKKALFIFNYFKDIGLMSNPSKYWYTYTKLGKKMCHTFFKQAVKEKHSKFINFVCGHVIWDAVLWCFIYMVVASIILGTVNTFIHIPQKYQMAVLALGVLVYVMSACVLNDINHDNNQFNDKEFNKFLKDNLNENKYKEITTDKSYGVIKAFLFTNTTDSVDDPIARP